MAGIFICFEAFQGTKVAQSDDAIVESIGALFLLVEPHNVKVVGSNPTPATS
jgi:hypothetical protein